MKSIASVRLRKRRKGACENGYTFKCIQRSMASVINCEKCNIGVFSYTNLRAKIVTLFIWGGISSDIRSEISF